MTVEEALAQERAAREALEAQLAQAQQALQIQGRTLSAVTETNRETSVESWARGQQDAGLPPAFIEAASQIKLGQILVGTEDEPVEGLQLSVVTGTEEVDGEVKPKTLTLSGVDQIVDHLAATLPLGEDAARLAHTIANLDQINASAKPDEEAAKLKQLDSWERENHPERFDADGKRTTAA